MLAFSLVRRGLSVRGSALYRGPISVSSRPFHSALKRQLKAEKKAKDKETKLAQAATQQTLTVRSYVVEYCDIWQCMGMLEGRTNVLFPSY